MAETLLSRPFQTSSRSSADDVRAQIERGIEAALDLAHRLIALLDLHDGDPDLEPDADREDGADAEPAMAALVTANDAQIRWAGFEHGAAA